MIMVYGIVNIYSNSSILTLIYIYSVYWDIYIYDLWLYNIYII